MSWNPFERPTPPLDVLLRDEKELRRERQRRDRARAAAEADAALALDPSKPCPVCGGKLAVASPPPLPPALVRRPEVTCEKCRLALPWQPTPLGHWVFRAGSGGLAVVGLFTVLNAQQLADGSGRTTSFAVGAAILVFGASLWQQNESMADKWQLAGRIDGKRREHELGRPVPVPSRLGDTLRELVFAAVLYLILRHVAVEAFVIPTGSMAPTLYGNNIQQVCKRCHFPYRQGRGEFEPLTGKEIRTVCPVCGEVFSTYPTESTDGNKILVDKLVYQLRAPRRFEVVVFKFPQQPGRSYIKRLLGLPGESLRILDGDVYANGALQRKDDDVQDAIWLPFLDATYPFEGETPAEGAGPTLWAPARGVAPERWDVARDGRRLEARAGEGTAWLECQRKVKAYTSYNDRSGAETSPDSLLAAAMSDVRIRARVTPGQGAKAVRLLIQDDDRPILATFPVAGPGARFTIEAGGKVIASKEGGLTPDRHAELTLAYHDDRARLLVDGELLAFADDAEATPRLDDPDAPRHLAQRHVVVRLGADGPTVFEDVKLDRDVHYTPANVDKGYDPAVEPVVVPANAYFCCGDNSPSSLDSRYWGFVYEGHLQGQAFAVWWPLLPFEWRWVH